jgi:hypothetical protein
VNNQYSLITIKDTASYQVVMKSAFTANKTDELNFLNSIKRQSVFFPENSPNAEKLLLENPNLVLFGPEFSLNLRIKHYPCLITTTSRGLFKVCRV